MVLSLFTARTCVDGQNCRGYGGDRQLIGREINIDGKLVRVVGVLPRAFQFPTLEPGDVVQPMALNASAAVLCLLRYARHRIELLATQGKAILYISHIFEVVEQVCNRVVVIAKGKVLADAPPAELARLM